MNRVLLSRISILIPSAYLFISLFLYMDGDPFPPFNDGGNWLKIAYAILGNNYPMWEQTTFQYPPFFTSILALTSSIIGNELLALKLLGVISISILPLASYLVAKEISDSFYIGLVSSWLTAFSPIFQEMFGWGGYPNALGIFFLALSLLSLSRAIRIGGKRNYTLLIVFSFLTAITHHLTIIVLLGMLATSIIICAFLLRRSVILKPLITSFVSSLTGFAFWRILAGPFQYQVYNAASLQIRPFDSDVFWWTFKSPLVTTLLFILAFSGALWLLRKGRYTEVILISLWIIVPYLVTQTYFLGIALDFRRFPAFSVLPLCVLASMSSGWATEGLRDVRLVSDGEPGIEGRVSIGAVLLISLLSVLLIGNIAVGLSTQASVFQYYHSQVDYTYSGNERLDALNWIRERTSMSSVFVADETIGRWIEGYSHRRVVMKLDPYQSFIQGEVDRYKAADLIMSSNIEISNPYVRIRDGTPYFLSSTPTFSISDGLNYIDLIYITDAYVRVSFTKSGSRWIEAPYNPVSMSIDWLERDDNNATISMNYNTIGLFIEKRISMNESSKSVIVEYSVMPKEGVSLISLSLPIWIPFGSSLKLISSSKSIGIDVSGHIIYVRPIGYFTGYQVGVDNETSQQRVLLNFREEGNSILSGLQIYFQDAKKSVWRDGLDAYTSDELMKKLNVSYIAVGRFLYSMDRFYLDPRLQLAYSNSKIAIFMVKSV